MGRSVARHPHAVITAYAKWDRDYEDFVRDYDDDPELIPSERTYYDYYAPEEWQDSKEWFIDYAQELWPSFKPVNFWAGREVQVVLSNGLAEVSVSEYCGLTALCVAVTDEAIDSGKEGLAKTWIKLISEKFEATFGDYGKIGTFSNGESVYVKL